LRKFNGKLCTLDVGLSKFVEKFNIKNNVNSIGNYIHYMHGLSGFAKNQKSSDTLNAKNCVNPTRNCVY